MTTADPETIVSIEDSVIRGPRCCFFLFFSPVFPLSFIWADPRTEGLHLQEGVGPLGGEAWLVLAMEDLVGQWELDLGVMELLDHWSGHLLAVISSTFMIWIEGPGSVPGTHVSALGDGASCGQVPALPVHVVGATAGVTA